MSSELPPRQPKRLPPLLNKEGSFCFDLIRFIRLGFVVVYAYKMFPADNDVKELTAFTKKWTAKIIAANK